MRRYPSSEYAKDARVKIDMVQDQLAGKEMEIGRYYLNDNQPLAAIGRFKTVSSTYQTTSHTPEALYRLVEANEIMGLHEEAMRNGAVLGYNYPGDRWYAAASQPSHAEPRSPEEQAALAELPNLGAGAEVRTLVGATVSFEPTYASAAQRTCRGFVIQREPAEGAPMRRVACREGDAWFLVPDLLEDGSADGPEDSL